MIDMKKLAVLVRELDDQVTACTRCGTCQSVCPLFRETGQESGVARGKLAILKGLMEEAFKEPGRSLEQLSRCLLCGSCEANCPSGVRVLEVFLKARSILVGYLGLPPVKRAVFRRLLAHPERFNRLLALGARVQRLFIKPADELLGTSCARFTSPLTERHFKALAAVPFRRRISTDRMRSGGPAGRVAFFYGCLIDKIYPEIGEAVLRVLDRFGIAWVIPDKQGCCGLPALSAGDAESFYSLLSYNLKGLADHPFDHLITACPTCAAAIKHIWPAMVAELLPEDRERVGELARKTLDVTDFLVNRAGAGFEDIGLRLGVETSVTYHDPCHLKKTLKVDRAPRTMLKGIPGLRLIEMGEAEACCGCGGSFTLEHYELSRAMGERKRANILATGAETVVTACPACMLQISDLLSRGGDRIRVKHVMEQLAEGLIRK